MIFFCIRISHVIISKWQWVNFSDYVFFVIDIQTLWITIKHKRDFGNMRNLSFWNMHLYSGEQRSDWLIRQNRPILKSIIRMCSVNNRINSIGTYQNGTEQIRTDTNWYEQICIFRPVRSNMWVSLNKHIAHMVSHVYDVFPQKFSTFKKRQKFGIFGKKLFLFEIGLCVNQLTISQSRTL